MENNPNKQKFNEKSGIVLYFADFFIVLLTVD